MSTTDPHTISDFLSRCTVGADGVPYVETFRRPIFNAWSVDTTHRPPSQYKTVPYAPHLFEDTKPDGIGALSLEHLVRRQIVRYHVQELVEDVLEDIPWFNTASKVWGDVMRVGEDSWRVFRRFCAMYGHEKDFVAMLERLDVGGDKKDMRDKKKLKRRRIRGVGRGSASEDEDYNENEGVVPPTDFYNNPAAPEQFTPINPQTPADNSFRYRVQLIKSPLPPWSYSIPLLTAPRPAQNNNNFSWLVCLELIQSFDSVETWSRDDLTHSLGTLPNLAVLSIHGAGFKQAPNRIVQDGFLSQWARQARMGGRWGELRVLVIQERILGASEGERGRKDDQMELFRSRRTRLVSSSGRAEGSSPSLKDKLKVMPKRLFDDLDSFPRLSVVALYPDSPQFLPPQPPARRLNNSSDEEEEFPDPSSEDEENEINTSCDLGRRAMWPGTLQFVFGQDNMTLITEGEKHGWFSQRRRDKGKTLQTRPRLVRGLVRRAGVTGMRDLAQACSLLVEAEEKEKILLEGDGKDGDKEKDKTPPPPVMVNVWFQQNAGNGQTPGNILPPLRAYASGQVHQLQARAYLRAMLKNCAQDLVFEKRRGPVRGPGRVWAADSIVPPSPSSFDLPDSDGPPDLRNKKRKLDDLESEDEFSADIQAPKVLFFPTCVPPPFFSPNQPITTTHTGLINRHVTTLISGSGNPNTCVAPKDIMLDEPPPLYPSPPQSRRRKGTYPPPEQPPEQTFVGGSAWSFGEEARGAGDAGEVERWTWGGDFGHHHQQQQQDIHAIKRARTTGPTMKVKGRSMKDLLGEFM